MGPKKREAVAKAREPLREIQEKEDRTGSSGNRKKVGKNVSTKPMSPPLLSSLPCILSTLHECARGFRGSQSRLHRTAVDPVVDNVAEFSVSRLATVFNRRVTALAWSHSHPYLAAAGSNEGDIILWNTRDTAQGHKDNFLGRIEGRGPGGSIQSLLFDEIHEERVFTSSIDGRVARRDFTGREDKVYLDTHNWENWYVGMDVCFSGGTIVAGNNKGAVTLCSLDGEIIWTHKLHKAKCNFVQFNKKQPWMMVTTSIGSSKGGGVAKIWDIRMISGADSSLAEMEHDVAVNSAYFSPMAGDMLLTTDQHSQLRVYQAPNFTHMATIPHPHRQFQHLTPIKAVWHPLTDLIVVGRYPDPKFPDYTEGEVRSIDFYCPYTGRELLRLHQLGLNMIMSLSQFNPIGDRLLSGMGGNGSLLLWQDKRSCTKESMDSMERDREVESNLEGLKVQQWPDFQVKKKKGSNKKKGNDK